MNVKQPLLGSSGTLFFLVIVSAFPPLTTDLYLPALPTMVEMLNTTQTMVNLTLSVYFVTYALGLLFWGPLSEKFGRKPIMLLGLGIYVLASLLCAMANNIEMLIGARLIQAFGGSAVTVVATAIVKDLYNGREREKIMATIMSLVIIAPMIAPVLGAFLLKIGSWHMMFSALAIFGAFSTVLACGFSETIPKRYTGSILRSWGRLAVVSNNPRFISLLLIFTLPPMTLMSFLAAGSYIYIDGFGLSEQTFSYAFAFNAFFASFGPTIYIKLSNRVKVSNIISVCYLILMLIGILTYNLGHLSPWLFACLAAPATLMVIVTRVPGINLMLEQHTSDTGSAVAVIQFCSMMAGAIGMTLVTLHPDNLIHSLGIIQFSIGALASIMWFMAKNRAFVVDHLTTS
ncbi:MULTISPECIES: multidrug effflux MFS transporter [Shewanella]|uniref:Bcr/CflA family efflux transporter n=1 Tax=Shewanella metallivivens TaxID=2872342 RepID=A0ABT5TII0_9GAMM|nr:multidrug effflux MFS transporter [Shewanella metallivivens]MDD8058415.1 multidrug effflux MFS transporter [Shewanella metallivivens]